MPKVSVIVPIYKVEAFLPACLDSLLAQTFTDWEAVCVNDGSPDNCGAILAEYAQKDNRIKVITQENQGLSMARNNGLKNAVGDYIFFLDSDDFVHPQLLEICYTLAQKESAEMVSFSLSTFAQDETVAFSSYTLNDIPYQTTDSPLFYQKKRCQWKVSVNACTKLYKKSLIEDLSFIAGITYEDYPHTYDVLSKHPHSVLLELPLYFYRTNPNSISNTALSIKNIQDYATGLKSIMDRYDTAPKKERQFIERQLIPNILKQQYNRILSMPKSQQELLMQELSCTLHIIQKKGFLHPWGHKLKRYLKYRQLIQAENPIRKLCVKVLCLCFCLPKHRHKIRLMLMKRSVFHLIKVFCLFKFKQPKSFKHNLSLVLCIKDEGQYIKEWLEYYLIQGVNHFYIYNNNGTDNTKEIIDSYIQKGLVTWHDYPGRRQQENIYNHAVHHYKNETRWMGFIDIDEFIVPLKHPSIADFLTSFEDCSQINIPWVMYGSGGHIQKPDGLVIESYKKHQKGFSPTVKSIVNPRAVVYAQVHFHLVFGLSVDEKKNIFYKSPNITTADLICCNHYFTKSYEEFCAKRNRGRAISCSPLTSDFFVHANYNDIEDDIMDKYVDLIKKRIQQ